MKQTTLYMCVAAFGLLPTTMGAQTDMDRALADIESHNTTLKALRAETESSKLANHTDITLPDPEVEFAYLWGSPSSIGSRKDISAKQTFDAATLLGARRKVANAQDGMLEQQYLQKRLAVLLEAKKLLVQLVYANAMNQQLQQRYDWASQLAEAYKQRLAHGDVNAMEVNKTTLAQVTARAELQQMEVERLALLQQLQGLNGGEALTFTQHEYVKGLPSGSFDEWFTQAEQRNPLLKEMEREMDVNRQQIALNKAQGLPSFSVGYTSELLADEKFRGVSVGMSIPLWSNRNRVKQSKAALQATESRLEDGRLQFRSQLMVLYNRTRGLQQTAQEFRTSLAQLNNATMLKKALDAGQISVLEYLTEQSLYYDAVDRMWQAERDYQLSLAELQMVEL